MSELLARHRIRKRSHVQKSKLALKSCEKVRTRHISNKTRSATSFVSPRAPITCYLSTWVGRCTHIIVFAGYARHVYRYFLVASGEEFREVIALEKNWTSLGIGDKGCKERPHAVKSVKRGTRVRRAAAESEIGSETSTFCLGFPSYFRPLPTVKDGNSSSRSHPGCPPESRSGYHRLRWRLPARFDRR